MRFFRYLFIVVSIILGVSGPVFAALSQTELEQAYLSSYQAERAGKYEAAMSALDAVSRDYPASYTLNLRLGYLNYLTKRYALALDHYSKASVAAPASVDPKLSKMTVLLAQFKYADAEQVGYQLVNIDYANYFGNLRLVYALRMQQKYELAEKVTSKMLAFYPIDASFMAEYGILKYATGNFDQSRRVFSDMLVLDSSNLLARDYIKLIDKKLAGTVK